MNFRLRFFYIGLALVSSAGITACGGGSSSGSAVNPPVNGLISEGNGNYVDPFSGNFLISDGGDTYFDTTTGDTLMGSAGNFYDVQTGEFVLSQTAQTKDVDLQQAQAQTADVQSRAQALSDEFGMNFQSAVQLTQISDQMNAILANGGQLSADEQDALLQQTYAVIGVTGDAVRAAAQQLIQNKDNSAAEALVVQAAAHLGMSSPETLRDQILPQLGINLN